MELFRALALLAEPPGPRHAEFARLLGIEVPDEASYTDVFVFQLFPYASVYLGAEGKMGGEARDRVAGFLRALGVVPPTEPDHLAVLLSWYAELAEREAAEPDPARRDARRGARKALCWEHLASWVPGYLAKLDEIAPPPYRAWGELLGEALEAETRELGPPDALPLHLREAPGPPDPRTDDPKGFLPGLLAPVRTGMILVRDDLARAARTLGLGLRMGERRFVLESLWSQDAPATLGWLADEAQRWAGRWRDLPYGHVAQHQAGRAETTARLLRELRDDAVVAADAATGQ